jgi:hypothetical protein
MKVDQAKKYKGLKLENARLMKLVADLPLREAMLKEVILSPVDVKIQRAGTHGKASRL